MRNMLKKIVTILIIISVLVIGCILYVNTTDTKIIIYENNRQTENGLFISESNLKLKQGINKEYIVNNIGTCEFIVTEGNEVNTYNYKDLGIIKHVDTNTLQKLNTDFIIRYKEFKVITDYSVLKSKLEEFNINRYDTEYASISKVNNNFIIKEEKIGNLLDIEKLYDYIVNSKEYSVEIKLEDFYKEIDSTKVRQSHYENELNKIENTYITYSNEYKLQLIDLIDFLEIEDNNIVISENNTDNYRESIKSLIKENLKDFNTVGKEFNFINNKNEEIKVSGGTWGDEVDIESELDYIIDKFSKFSNDENRVPILSKDYDNEIPDTYIEISIEEQHLWYYRDKEIVIDSDIVTGTKGRNDTPLGVYYISEKIDGKYLRGDDYVTWVNKWLRITNRGHGLHDATWRGSFGNKIYTYNGSHGCINLPKDFAYKLFEEVDVGSCVVIY